MLISETYFEEIIEKIEKLNKKARKLGCREAEIAVRGWIDVKEKNEVDRKWDLEVMGEAPKYNGWTFVAKLEKPQGCATHLIYAVPGEEVPERFRHTNVNTCEHCNRKRSRKATYVVRHDSGEHKQVGSSCMKDFLGHANPEALVKSVDMYADLELCLSEYEGCGGRYRMWELEAFLAYTVMCVRENGWVSRSTAHDQGYGYATADAVVDAIEPPKPGQKEKPRPTEHDWNTAKKVVEYLPKLFEEQMSDYTWNLKNATDGGMVSYQTAGIVASAVACYNRHEKIERAKKDVPESNWVGEIKQRIDFEATLISQNYYESDFGTTHIMKFRSDEGNVFTWFSSRCLEVELEQSYKIRATIKKHDQYKGVKQTVITRASLS